MTACLTYYIKHIEQKKSKFGYIDKYKYNFKGSPEYIKKMEKIAEKITYRTEHAEKVLYYKSKLKDEKINVDEKKKLKWKEKLNNALEALQHSSLNEEEINTFVQYYNNASSTLVKNLLEDPYYMFAGYGSGVFRFYVDGSLLFVNPIELLDMIRGEEFCRSPEKKFSQYASVARDESTTLKKYDEMTAYYNQKFKNIINSVNEELSLLYKLKSLEKNSDEFKIINARIKELLQTRDKFTPEEKKNLILYFRNKLTINCGYYYHDASDIIREIVVMIDDPYRFFTDYKIKVDFDQLGFDILNIINEKVEIARNNSDTWLSDEYDNRLYKIIYYSKKINTLEEEIRNNKDKSKNENFKKELESQELESLKEKKKSYLMDESEKKKLIAYFNESGLPQDITTQFINMVKSQNCFPFYEYMVGQDDKLEIYDKNNVLVLTLTRRELESRPCECFLKLKKVNFIKRIDVRRTKKKEEFASNKDIRETNNDNKICNNKKFKDDLQKGENPNLSVKKQCLQNNEINLNQHNSDYNNMEIPFQCKNQDKNSGKHSDFATCVITAGIVISLALVLLTQALSGNQSQNKQ